MHRELRDLNLVDLQTELYTRGHPRYRAAQVFRWIHGRRAASFAQMKNLPTALREQLEGSADLTPLSVDRRLRAQDGTEKLALRTADGRIIESVLIPEDAKLTLCISSQVGCALDCSFCATATLGFGRQLSAGEIVDQVYRAADLASEQGRRITNLVFMGMGEPLHNFDQVQTAIENLTHGMGMNFSHRRITLSTAGLVPGIEKLGRSKIVVNLAISLNATTDRVRDQIMPINRKWNIAQLLAAVRRYPLERRRRVTFEYVLLAGLNDTPEDAARLPRLLRGIPAKVNLIPWNPHPSAPYARPSWEDVLEFQNAVRASGLAVYVRRPRGDDIQAACGQLAGTEMLTAITLDKSRATPSA